MPELPEVETVCRSLRPHIIGRTIKSVKTLEPRLRVLVNAAALARLAGRKLRDVGRRGKYILIRSDRNIVWVFHLGMSGKLIWVEPGSARRKHDHIIVRL